MKTRTVYDALKYETDARLSCGNRWLVMDELDNKWEFVVYEHKYGQKKTTELYRGDHEEWALRVLTQEEE
jgi:hypothetical protein